MKEGGAAGTGLFTGWRWGKAGDQGGRGRKQSHGLGEVWEEGK